MPKIMINLMTMLKLDATIMDDLLMPFTGNDRETCIANIVRETMPLSVSVTDPAILKYEIAVWSRKRLPVWTRLYNTLDLKYDPISNYNRTEEWVDRADDRMRNATSGTADHNENGTTSGENSANTTVTDNGTHNSTTDAKQTGTVKNDGKNNSATNAKQTGTVSNSGTNSRTANTTENGTELLQVQAFNESALTDSEKKTTNQTQNVTENGTADTTETTDMTVNTTVNGTQNNTETTDMGTVTTVAGTDTNTQTTTAGGTNSGTTAGHSTDTSNGTNDTDSVHFSSHKARMYGNIGVTTTQQMIEQERSIALFDLFSVIINDFKSEFCILIY